MKQESSFSLKGKLKDYLQLVKITLSFTVVFSCVVCYLLAPGVVFNGWMVSLLFFAGLLITGSANAINQAMEKDTDSLMKRTASRPVASGRMSENEALTFAAVSGALGIFLIGWFFHGPDSSFNYTAASLSAFSLFLYAFVYTPLKKVNSISVLVGAVPGALPCLIGWTAGTESMDLGGWVLFGIQFVWQFPHFWAIAWISHKDYSAAGFKLMPSTDGPGRFSAMQAVVYSVLLLPVGLLPYFAHISGLVSLFIVLGANLFMVFQSVRLYREMTAKAARRVMFSSYLHLPVVLLSLWADKIG